LGTERTIPISGCSGDATASHRFLLAPEVLKIGELPDNYVDRVLRLPWRENLLKHVLDIDVRIREVNVGEGSFKGIGFTIDNAPKPREEEMISSQHVCELAEMDVSPYGSSGIELDKGAMSKRLAIRQA
jgi:hypothetical protein